MKIKVIPVRRQKPQAYSLGDLLGKKSSVLWKLVFNYVPEHFDQYLEDAFEEGVQCNRSSHYYDTYLNEVHITNTAFVEFSDGEEWDEETEQLEDTYDCVSEYCYASYRFKHNEGWS